MEKFVVSARKYRPITFNTVVGQPILPIRLRMRSAIIILRRHSFSQAHVELEKPLQREFWQRRSIAQTFQLKLKRVIRAKCVLHSMKDIP